MDLFDYMKETTMEKESPLASRMRPTTLDEVVGQEHIIGPGKLLYRAIKADKLGSVIFYGPPGTGKTTLARVIANTTSAEFTQLNATTAGKKDMEEVVKEAQQRIGMYGKKTILFVDEIHRFNKGQQDYLLPFVEDGTLVLIGATTENPYFEVNGALISRSIIFELKPLEKEDIEKLLERAVIDAPPVLVRDGGVIAPGYSEELDEWRGLADGATDYLDKLEIRERERLGLDTLKVGYNAVHGYYIQISRGQSHLAPIHYVRRQTLKNAERYIIPELKEYEDKVLTSKGKALALEKQLYDELFDLLLPHLADLQASASALAELDVLVNLAERAETLNYCCPTFSDKPGIRISEGRHPVVEQVLKEPFIANPLQLAPQRRMLIITGPNMGGKSTYMRQTALIALLAYIGSYVPAQKVEIGPIDRIFTRVGAADDLASGRSTFMVEMTETANILHNATEHSLVLMDEIGRGTSTYDGLSLAWACAENLANKIKALTLFATHYFELTQLPEKMEGVANVHLDALEHGDTIAFMHSVQDGAASKSYGLAVAALAGVPKEVIKRARQKLRELESISPNAAATQVDGTQMSLLAAPEETSPAVEALENLDPDSLTPRQALEWIYRLKSLV